MRRTRLGARDASMLGLGMMGLEPLDDAQVRELFGTARELGVDVFDHADIYGSEWHACERRFGEALRLAPSERDAIVIQSKCGIQRDVGGFDFSAEHIVRQVEGSLEALRTDRLDVLLLHRPDALVEPEEVARAFAELERSGKVRAFGVSNHTPAQIELLRSAVRQPLIADQVQFGLGHAGLVAQGVAANMEGLPQSEMRDGGLVDWSRLNGVRLQAWSPFRRGFFAGSLFDRDAPKALRQALQRVADVHGLTPSSVAAAWIARHPAEIQTIVGTTRPERLREAAAGIDVRLSRAEWYELLAAAGYTIP
ncbi:MULTISPECIES: aldo/keto reductase [unclassified Leucobacter]|uniref:aldo/keto reductase n=1 Tax=unclassified Leucobacter TaxID=2621730 RepID=UPI00062295F9|nr:aldo/keto reductase [Leucobacter sp. Ag1]KKI17095.1 aldo/keto reductase [Leucobacter sp. Ag1]